MRIRLILATATLVVVGGVAPASAAVSLTGQVQPRAASSETSSAGTVQPRTSTGLDAVTKHCASVVKADPATREMKVVWSRCTTDASTNPADAISADCGCKTLLWTVYQHIDYGGSRNDLYGNEGTCDSAGYLFRDMRAVNDLVGGITSYRLYGGCTAGQVCSQTGFGGCTGLLFGSQAYIAGYRNDHVYSAIVLHG